MAFFVLNPCFWRIGNEEEGEYTVPVQTKKILYIILVDDAQAHFI